MAGNVHAVVQHPHYVHTFRGRLVKDDMGSVLVAPQSRREFIGISPNPGSLSQVPETGFQAVTIMTGLFDTELVNAEFGDVR